MIEHYKQEALVHVLQQPVVKDCAYVFRNSIQLEFLAAGVWDGAEYRGTITDPLLCATASCLWALSATITMLSEISSPPLAGGSTLFSGASTRGNEAGMEG